MKKSFAQIIEDAKKEERKKLSSKIPEWDGVKGLIIPSSLSIEQCSSSATARYKAELLLGAFGGQKIGTVCDITGGLGADDIVGFSRIAKEVHYFERDKVIAEAAQNNAKILGINNIVFRCESIDKGSTIPKSDVIFADPARRDGAGKKVFLLEDCSPDILSLLPMLWEVSPLILLKLSPLADISMLSSRLGERLSEVHIVSCKGEVKELLCLMRKGHSGWSFEIVAADASLNESFRFKKEEEASATATFAKEISLGDTLIEPSPAIMKSGAFRLLCYRFGWEKLDTSTHLYVCGKPMEKGGNKLFKYYSVLENLPFNKSNIEALSKRGLKADVSARNVHISSEELRKRLHCAPSDGERLHVFACHTAFAGERILICQKILL